MTKEEVLKLQRAVESSGERELNKLKNENDSLKKGYSEVLTQFEALKAELGAAHIALTPEKISEILSKAGKK